MSKSKVTLKNIAEELTISATTVSCVLRGDAVKFRISESTQKKIMSTANEMGYVPNLNARNLRSKKSGCISVLFSDLELNWSDTLLKGIESVLYARGYGIFIAIDRNEPQIFRHQANSILQRCDEAVICHSQSIHKEGINQLMDSLPLVFVSDLPESFDLGANINAVLWDSSQAIRMAIKHFADEGRKKIAFIGARHGFVSDMKRFEAFKKALDEFELESSQERFVWLPGATQSQRAVEILFSDKTNHPDAIFALNDSIALNILKILRVSGVKVPQDTALIGVGDLPMSEYVGLSTIVEPLIALGQNSAKMAISLIEGQKVSSRDYIVDETKIILRQTA